MNAYESRPWLAHYPSGLSEHLDLEFGSPLEAFDAALAAAPDAPAVHYFGATLSWADLDAASDALAHAVQERGFAVGDRLGIAVQNEPAVVIGLLAAWKAGGVAALISPMYKRGEFRRALDDFTPTALLILDEVHAEVADELGSIGLVITASPLDFAGSDDLQRVFDVSRVPSPGTVEFLHLIGTGSRAVTRHAPAPDDVAVLAPTSGTTGPPKGAKLTHRNLAFSAQAYRTWTGLEPGEPILCMSPIFHVTGLVGSVMLALSLRSPLVLTHRFDAGLVLDAVRAWRPAFAVASITAYIALADHPDASPEAFESLRLRYSGGAPVLPDVAERISERLGGMIHNVYGQTESTSPTHMVPPGVLAPVDPETGALSVGLPIFDTMARVVDERGEPLPPGTFGEIVTAGPQIAAGYWGQVDDGGSALRNGEMRTGDVGFMDADGWFYVIDRSNDLINASGYKIWPFEIEQVLQSHPAVLETAVVGIPDDYRGESTRAYVALQPGAEVTPTELIEYCRERMAAYKYPREVEIVGALPRSATGKLLRRELR
ncbi:long-chain fatty acid--CoA ligase [Gordonia rubripertincta]|uniref:class I adenylate-forming enzyme family protein n=1 Tax=Gordonia rubripertincta TaxID=36822 RepID=UPI00117D624C|nr:AMP-binding protein [Gordonia rubripertincta]TSD92949.1 long-chain fatty acid--CoA ligase [Gordonia rubripertincta]